MTLLLRSKERIWLVVYFSLRGFLTGEEIKCHFFLRRLRTAFEKKASWNRVCYLEPSVRRVHVEEGVVGDPVAVVVDVNGARHT